MQRHHALPQPRRALGLLLRQRSLSNEILAPIDREAEARLQRCVRKTELVAPRAVRLLGPERVDRVVAAVLEVEVAGRGRGVERVVDADRLCPGNPFNVASTRRCTSRRERCLCPDLENSCRDDQRSKKEPNRPQTDRDTGLQSRKTPGFLGVSWTLAPASAKSGARSGSRSARG